jgi:hypothetical protein
MYVEEKLVTFSVTPHGAEQDAKSLVSGLLMPKEFSSINNANFYACLKTALIDKDNPIGYFAWQLLKSYKDNPTVRGLVGEVATIRTLQRALPYVCESTYDEDTVERIDCFMGQVPIQIKTTSDELLHTAVYTEPAELYDLALVYLELELYKLGRGEWITLLRAESSSLISCFGTGNKIPPMWAELKHFLGSKYKGKFSFFMRFFEEIYTLEQLKKRNEGAMVILVNASDIDWDLCELNDAAAVSVFEKIL